jgi:hypothetical protein
MDLATLIKPILTAGQLRVVGSTTHEDFKHIEKGSGAGAPAAEDHHRRAVDPRNRSRSSTACALATRRTIT